MSLLLSKPWFVNKLYFKVATLCPFLSVCCPESVIIVPTDGIACRPTRRASDKKKRAEVSLDAPPTLPAQGLHHAQGLGRAAGEPGAFGPAANVQVGHVVVGIVDDHLVGTAVKGALNGGQDVVKLHGTAEGVLGPLAVHLMDAGDARGAFHVGADKDLHFRGLTSRDCGPPSARGGPRRRILFLSDSPGTASLP